MISSLQPEQFIFVSQLHLILIKTFAVDIFFWQKTGRMSLVADSNNGNNQQQQQQRRHNQ